MRAGLSLAELNGTQNHQLSFSLLMCKPSVDMQMPTTRDRCRTVLYWYSGTPAVVRPTFCAAAIHFR